LKHWNRNLKIEAGETDRKGEFSLEVVACIGACGLAPVISINGEFHAGVNPKDVPAILEQYRNSDGGAE
jgi:NADH:ubiquinone oxidoreductase subunit E